MIKFNPAIADELAMEITDQKTADLYLRDYILHLEAQNSNLTRDEAKIIARQNIGYYSGYFSYEVAERVEKLFGAIHPIFGDVESRKKLSPAQIFELGKAYAIKYLKS